jgi:hypothetical protein
MQTMNTKEMTLPLKQTQDGRLGVTADVGNPLRSALKAIDMHAKHHGIWLNSRAAYCPGNLLKEWETSSKPAPQSNFLQRQGAAMMLLSLFDAICMSSPEARQAALDLGLQPVFEQAQGEADHV